MFDSPEEGTSIVVNLPIVDLALKCQERIKTTH